MKIQISFLLVALIGSASCQSGLFGGMLNRFGGGGGGSAPSFGGAGSGGNLPSFGGNSGSGGNLPSFGGNSGSGGAGSGKAINTFILFKIPLKLIRAI